MNWHGKKVAVTGAGGFIGSHLCEALVGAGAEVTAFVRYTSRGGAGLLDMLPKDARAAILVVHGDLRDEHAVERAVAQRDYVFHLGALIAIPYSYLNPGEVVDVNVKGTQNVLEAARRAGVTRLIHTSTSEVYGTAVTAAIDESHRLNAQTPYSASKIAADALAFSYHCSFGLPVSILRPFNTYGPRQSGRAVIPATVGQALGARSVRLGALAPTRDFTFVRDTVAAFLAIAASPATVGETVAIGTGTEISIGDLARKVLARVGRDIPIETEAQRMRPRDSEVFRLVCDPSRAARLMDWHPTVTLDQGLDEVIAFIRDNPDWTRVASYEV